MKITIDTIAGTYSVEGEDCKQITEATVTLHISTERRGKLCVSTSGEAIRTPFPDKYPKRAAKRNSDGQIIETITYEDGTTEEVRYYAKA